MTSLLGNINRYDVTFDHGDGVWLYDTNGDSYLDMLGGVAVCALGHAHPALTAAIAKQAARLLHVSNLFYTPEIVEAADAIVAKIGPGRVYLSNSGTEANEAAIKAVRKLAWRAGETDRIEIVAIDGSFHGRTMGSLAATMQAGKREGFGPLLEGFLPVPINDVAALEACVSDKTAAIVIEPIQGESGINPLTTEFAQAARRLAGDNGALLVVDEIQTGIARTGKWWGYEHLGITPDVVTMAKALGGGFPIGATWLAEHVSTALQPGDHSTTQGGGPLACAAAIATLRTIEEESLVERCGAMGKLLADAVRPLGTEVRGAGLLVGLELGEPIANAVVKAALGEKLIVNDVNPSTIRIAPSLLVSEEEIEQCAQRLGKAIGSVKS